MTTTFVQWKGTDICMDFYCPKCDHHSHFDGFFAYTVRCPACRTRFKLPDDLVVKEVPEDDPAPCLEAEAED